MLSIRLQRLGRKGYPVYRVVVQDSRQSPDSGKYIALLGNYNPHTKDVKLDKAKAELYLKNGAQPSDRIVSLFKAEKVALPDWVKEPSKQERNLKNPDKLRKNRPAEAEAPAEAASESEAAASPEEPAAEPAEQAENTEPAEEAEAPAEEAPVEEEKPAEASEEAPSEPASEPAEQTENTEQDEEAEAPTQDPPAEADETDK